MLVSAVCRVAGRSTRYYRNRHLYRSLGENLKRINSFALFFIASAVSYIGRSKKHSNDQSRGDDKLDFVDLAAVRLLQS